MHAGSGQRIMRLKKEEDKDIKKTGFESMGPCDELSFNSFFFLVWSGVKNGDQYVYWCC